MARFSSHIYILLTVLLTVYSQLVMRWQVGIAGPLPADLFGKVGYIVGLLINPWVLTGILATFCAGVSWMMTLTQFQIGYAYPFVSLTYVLVMFGGIALFNDSVGLSRLVGTAVVMVGVLIIARGG
jgi:multidrug transporter EmrE-like cation transporter